MEYNTGNYDKYTTKNKLKRKMISRFNSRISMIVRKSARRILTSRRKAGSSGKLRVLDAGCGEGFMSRFILEKLNGKAEITGLEYTSEAIETAKKMSSDIRYVQGDITAMPFETDSFDIVICTEVLEHLNEPDSALSELLRVSKDTLIISVPHEPWFCIGNLLALKNVRRLGNPIDHINHWGYSGFRKFLNEHSNQKWNMSRSFPWTIAECKVDEKQ